MTAPVTKQARKREQASAALLEKLIIAEAREASSQVALVPR